MNPKLVSQAAAIVPETGTLVNMVRQRVRQLASGHRPLILALPGTGLADIALREIAEGKLVSEEVPAALTENSKLTVLPAPSATKKAA